ncbi:MAG: ATP-binding protein [Saprospiraceae bacterium]|jgi:signal transduction histidine kinase|nr:ATP-binding protein [Saprospiraceae bacterium]
MSNLRLRLLSYVIMAYMLMAFAWWSMLLFTKNNDAFHAKRDLLKIGMIAEGRVRSNTEFEQTIDYLELARKYKRQEYMIFGEAMVFVLTLLAGLWFINQGYQREVRANNQRRNFLLSITHELKSPIASIRLVLETILKRELPRDKTNQLSTSALRENERLHELVENLLLSAKLETAYLPHFEEMDLANLLEDLLAKLADRHPEASIALEKPDDFPLLKMDKQGILSMATNLLENAIKYADGRPEVEVQLSKTSKHVTLSFADKGIGIPDKEKKRVFEKFYRIGSEETRQTKGTGLGLFIVQQVVKAHNGQIQVLDNQPKGTIFKITIPT